jgi:hypothetical protein
VTRRLGSLRRRVNQTLHDRGDSDSTYDGRFAADILLLKWPPGGVLRSLNQQCRWWGRWKKEQLPTLQTRRDRGRSGRRGYEGRSIDSGSQRTVLAYSYKEGRCCGGVERGAALHGFGANVIMIPRTSTTPSRPGSLRRTPNFASEGFGIMSCLHQMRRTIGKVLLDESPTGPVECSEPESWIYWHSSST